MHENVFKRFPDADISASIVWIPILDNDSLEAAISSAALLTDYRIQHFYDHHKNVGKMIADSDRRLMPYTTLDNNSGVFRRYREFRRGFLFLRYVAKSAHKK